MFSSFNVFGRLEKIPFLLRLLTRLKFSRFNLPRIFSTTVNYLLQLVKGLSGLFLPIKDCRNLAQATRIQGQVAGQGNQSDLPFKGEFQRTNFISGSPSLMPNARPLNAATMQPLLSNNTLVLLRLAARQALKILLRNDTYQIKMLN